MTASVTPPFYRGSKRLSDFARSHTLRGRADSQSLSDTQVQDLNHYFLGDLHCLVYSSSVVLIKMHIRGSCFIPPKLPIFRVDLRNLYFSHNLHSFYTQV